MTISKCRAVLFCTFIIMAAAIIYGAVPQIINYQGRLTGSTGTPFTGNKLMKFTLYDINGAVVWNSGFISVTCAEGLFSANLGSSGQPPLPVGIFADTGISLGITVDTDPEISPRVKLTSEGFAYHSLNADTSDVAKTIFNNSVNSSKIVDGSIASVDIGQNGATLNQVMKWSGSAWIAANDSIGSSTYSDTAAVAKSILNNTVTSAKIVDGSVSFVDIDQNGATPDQIMKWNGTTWAAANDETGAASGWIHDVGIVRLEAGGDSVGIGIAVPTSKVDLNGTMRVRGNMSLSADSIPNPNIGLRVDKTFNLNAACYGISSKIINASSSTAECYGIYSNTQTNSWIGYGVYGTASPSGTNNMFNVGVLGEANSVNNSVGFGIYGIANGPYSWAGFFQGNVSIATDGRLAIGVSAPAAAIDVAGDIQASGIIKSGSSLTLNGSLDQITTMSGKIDFVANTLITSGRVGVGTNTPSSPLYVAGTDSIAGYFTSSQALNKTHVVHAEVTGSGSGANPVAIYGRSAPAVGYGIGGSFAGGSAGVYATAQDAGSNPGGSAHGVYGFSGTGATNNYGVRGIAQVNSGYVYGLAGSAISSSGTATKYGNSASASGPGTNYGVYGSASGGTTNWAGYFSGNVNVTGTLSKGGGSFRIDHPLDPENKYLQHSFVESPDMMNIYNGNVVTDAEGLAVVELPNYFEVLNRDFRYQLTVIGQFAQAIIAGKIVGNQFTIKTDKPQVEVSWQVTGIRKDAWAEQNRIEVEVDKRPEDKGKYLYPAALGKPATDGIDYESSIIKSDRPVAADQE